MWAAQAVVASRRCLHIAALALCVLSLTMVILYHRPSLREAGYEYAAKLADKIPSLRGGKQQGFRYSAESSPSEHDGYVAMCIAIKDQMLDMAEYVNHHYHHMNISHFYFQDDGSDPPMSTYAGSVAQQAGVPLDAMTFRWYNRSEHLGWMMQYKLNKDCVQEHGHKHKWLTFFDMDEFLDTPGNESFVDVLRSLETRDDVGALGVNWQVHTSNGQLERQRSVRRAYTECIYDDAEHNGEGSDNRHVKSVVRPGAYPMEQTPGNPHAFPLNDGKLTVGEDGRPINPTPMRQPISRDRVSLHHYAVKSKAEYDEKCARGNPLDAPKDGGLWRHIEHDLPHVECLDMLRWVKDEM